MTRTVFNFSAPRMPEPCLPIPHEPALPEAAWPPCAGGDALPPCRFTAIAPGQGGPGMPQLYAGPPAAPAAARAGRSRPEVIHLGNRLMDLERILDTARERLAREPRDVLEEMQRLRATLLADKGPRLVRALTLGAQAAYQLGQLSLALRFSSEAVVLLGEGVPAAHAAEARNIHGMVLLDKGNYAEAFQVLQKALGDAAAAPDGTAMPVALTTQGALLASLGDHEAAAALLLQAHRLAKGHDPLTAAKALYYLCTTWLGRAESFSRFGDDASATRYALVALEMGENAMALFSRKGDSRGVLKSLEPVVRASLTIRDVRNARAMFEQAIERFDAGLRTDPLARLSLAQIERGEGQLDAAIAELVAIQVECGTSLDRHSLVQLLTVLVDCYDRAGKPREALAALRQLNTLRLDDHRILAREYARQLQGQLVSQRNEGLMYIAHDLIAPLSAVVALARTQGGDADFQRAGRYASRALALADQLLETLRLDRIDADSFTEVELGSVVDDACDTLSVIAAEERIELKVNPLFGIFTRGNRDALLRAVTNLVHNALKASPPGSTVQVDVQVYSPCHADIVVQDQGGGMPPAAQAVLARHEDERPPLHGPRMGLRYVAKVADTHRARIFVTSGSQGTRVIFRLERIDK